MTEVGASLPFSFWGGERDLRQVNGAEGAREPSESGGRGRLACFGVVSE